MINKKKIFIWLARILGGIAVLFFGILFIGEGTPDLIAGDNGLLRSMMILMAFAFLGYIFAWFREKEGGWILTISGFLTGLYIFYNSGMKDILSVLVFSVPFLISGLLFVYAGKSDN